MSLGTALLHLQARCAVDPRAARVETWEAVVTAMQLYSALFAVTGNEDGTVQCRIAHEMRTIPAIGPRPYADAGNWLTAFWLAVICRDQKRLTQLCQVPLESLRFPEEQFDEYIYHWVAALQAYWLQRPGLVEEPTAALQGSHPEVATIAPGTCSRTSFIRRSTSSTASCARTNQASTKPSQKRCSCTRPAGPRTRTVPTTRRAWSPSPL